MQILKKQKNILKLIKVQKKIDKAEKITPKDDAFHGSKKHWSAEWWYFDAIFENGYSMHAGFKTYSKRKHGFVSPIIEFYKNGEIEERSIKRHFFKDFDTSYSKPIVKLFGKKIIEFDIKKYKKNNEWIYYIDLDLGKNKAKLEFTGMTDGFKYVTENESWVVAQPKSTISGEIVINNKKIKVKGTGYHDHNWNYNLITIMKGWGWYWGRITSKTYNIVWANIMKNKKEGKLLAVVNIDNNGYYMIDPKKIKFRSDRFIRDHKRKTPTHFSLKFEDNIMNKNIKAEIEMQSYKTHFNSVLIAPYWRYHVSSEGFISIDSEKEQINKNQIMEFLRFS